MGRSGCALPGTQQSMYSFSACNAMKTSHRAAPAPSPLYNGPVVVNQHSPPAIGRTPVAIVGVRQMWRDDDDAWFHDVVFWQNREGADAKRMGNDRCTAGPKGASSGSGRSSCKDTGDLCRLAGCVLTPAKFPHLENGESRRYGKWRTSAGFAEFFGVRWQSNDIEGREIPSLGRALMRCSIRASFRIASAGRGHYPAKSQLFDYLAATLGTACGRQWRRAPKNN